LGRHTRQSPARSEALAQARPSCFLWRPPCRPGGPLRTWIADPKRRRPTTRLMTDGNHALTSAALWWDALVTCGGASRRACRCHDQRRTRAQERAEERSQASAEARAKSSAGATVDTRSPFVRLAELMPASSRACPPIDLGLASPSIRCRVSSRPSCGAYRRLRSLSAQRGNPGLRAPPPPGRPPLPARPSAPIEAL